MIALVTLLVPSTLAEISAYQALAPYRAMGSYSIRVLGPSAVDETVGVIRVYTFRADWGQTVGWLRSKLRNQLGLEEFNGFSGMRYFWNSTDRSFNWQRGADLPGIGLVRDFRATRNRIAHPFAPHLYGRRAKGWISVYTFDGTFVNRK